MKIDFPIEEYSVLQKQFETYGFAYTTRVSNEYNKYIVGNILETPWNRRVRVSEIKKFKKINDHPFINELTEKQIKEIEEWDDYEVIKLEYV